MSEIHPIVNHDEVGRRIDVLMKLHNWWSDGLAALLRSTYISDWDQERIYELESAIKLLNNYMMLGYSSTEYAREINKMATLSPEEKEFFDLPEDFKLTPLEPYKPNETEDMT